MDFKTIDGKHYINDKEVSLDAYISMLEESYEKLSQQRPIYFSPDSQEDSEFCPECQDILNLITDLSKMELKEAIDTFNRVIFKHRREAFMEGQIDAYEQLGSLGYKVAARIENDLQSEDFDE